MRRLVTIGVFAALTGALLPGPAEPVRAQSTACLVATRDGLVQGVDRGTSCEFLGIPFAAPPVNALRWRPPQPPAPWSGVLGPTVPPVACSSINATTGLPAGVEDCLRLNVWSPSPQAGALAPVIVWLHTGSFVAASANFAGSNGRSLAERTGVVVVAPNYRLGPFGFLAHPDLTAEDPAHPTSGNYGLLDQRAALAWVRANIAAFGGDPDNVTLAGTSAGGHSVGLHLVAPGSAGLFHRAVMQSGFASMKMTTRDEASVQGETLAGAVGCSSAPSVPACLRAAPRNTVLQALPLGTFEFRDRPVHWMPVVDGVVVLEQPRASFAAGAVAPVPVLLGVTRDEGWTWVHRSFPSGLTVDEYASAVQTEFGGDASAVLAQYPADASSSPKDALAQLTGDAEYTCEARRVARAIERTGAPVYLYSFEYEIDAIAVDRVVHGMEANFVFGNAFGPPLIASYQLTPADLVLSRAMGDYWVRFAATGNPNLDDDSVVHWPAFRHPSGDGRGADKFLILDATIRAAQRPRESFCDFWEPYFLRSLTGPVTAATP